MLQRVSKKKVALVLLFSLQYDAVFADVGKANEAAPQAGLEIMRELKQRDEGWGAASVELAMILENPAGSQSERKLRVSLLEVEGDGDKTLTVFDEPRDIKNTAFLSYSHALQPDDQWIYMPALKRTKRISSANKSGPFMGSEIAYEDISSFEVEKYDYSYVKDEIVDGVDCFVVELIPKYEHSGYTRIRYWVDKDRYIPIKIDYYDRANQFLKTQTFLDYQLHKDKFWRPERSEIENSQTDRRTILHWNDYDFNASLSESNFSRLRLSGAR